MISDAKHYATATQGNPMINIAARNRQLKKVLEAHYGRGTIAVRGSRGTGYGWVHVTITTPAELTRDAWQAEYRRVHELVTAANVEMFHFNSDEGNGPRLPCMNVSFRHDDAAQVAA